MSDKLFQLKLDAAWTRLAGGELETTMAEGYRAMGELNLSLAREDEAALAEWPDYTVETPEANPRGDS